MEILTLRQKQVLHEVCQGKSNKEIARALNVSNATVKLHLTEIFRTLGVKNRAQAMRVNQKNITVSDQQILEVFADTVIETDAPWSAVILKFGRALLNKDAES